MKSKDISPTISYTFLSFFLSFFLNFFFFFSIFVCLLFISLFNHFGVKGTQPGDQNLMKLFAYHLLHRYTRMYTDFSNVFLYMCIRVYRE